MTLSEKIQLATCTVTTLIGIISTCIAICTLKTNKKMIDESTRPYLVFYVEMLNTNIMEYHIILKNFGASGAIINAISTDFPLNNINMFNDNEHPFSSLENIFLAPGQKLYTTLSDSMLNDLPNRLKFNITYTSTSGISYENKFNINFNSFNGLAITNTEIKNSEHALKIIATNIEAYLHQKL